MKETYTKRISDYKHKMYPVFILKYALQKMKKKIDLDSQDFQNELEKVCISKHISAEYVNKHAHIVAAGYSSLPRVEQRLIANCMRLAMQNYDEL